MPQGRRAYLYCDGVDVRLGAPVPASANGSEFAAATAIVFNQTNAPLGWTKQTTHNDKALRLTSGTVGAGGATAFTSVFGAGKTTGSTGLSVAQLASHGHVTNVKDGANTSTVSFSLLARGDESQSVSSSITVGSNGSGSTHNHTELLDLQYVDVIIATKD